MAKHRQVSDHPCNLHVWLSNDKSESEVLSLHKKRFLDMKQMERGRIIFELLKGMYTNEYDELGCMEHEPGAGWFDYKLPGGRQVCQPVFLSAYPISRNALNKWEQMIRVGHRIGLVPNSPYKADNEGASQSINKNCDNEKHLFFVAWFLEYASQVGDLLPDDDVVVVPKREQQSLHDEYKAGGSLGGFSCCFRL
jgi:hypothetical protein